MKRFIINILIFFAIAAVVDLCVGLAGDYFQVHAKGGETKKTNDLVQNDCHDIVVFGSSRAAHHYDTPFLSNSLGLDVYNAGYDGNGVILSYGLLSMILERYNPKLIIYDVEPSFDIVEYSADNAHKRYISSLKPYYRRQGVSELIKDVSKEEWYKSHFGMMRYNTTIITKAMDVISGGKMAEKGFVPMSGEYSGGTSNNSGKDFIIDPFKLNYIERFLLLSKSKDVPVIVMASPKYGMVNSFDIKPVIEICKKHNVPFIDFYSDSVFMQHKEWFREPMHLNKKGARVFSERIVEIIKDYK